MPTPDSAAFAAATIAIYVAVLWLPGALVAAVAGARGWLLVAIAPLLTYTMAGLAGPYTHAVGLPFNLLTFLLFAALTIAVFAGLRLFAWRRRVPEELADPRAWPRTAHLAVAGCVLLAAVVGAIAVLSGLGAFNSIPQDWDAGFHANGMRYIAETGDGGLYGMSQVNWYLLDPGVFYPNAYHLVGALVYELSGASIAATLNVGTILTPALFALSLVAMIRVFRIRPVVAGYTALVAVAVTVGLYDSMTRGPLLPYLVGVALTPLVVALVRRYLDRPGPDTAALLAGGAIGLLAVHSSTLFGAVLILLPMFVQRWVKPGRTVLRDLRRIGLAAVPAIVLALPHLLGAISTRTNLPTHTWPKVYDGWQATGRLLLLQGDHENVQLAAAIACWIGLVLVWRLRGLSWMLGSLALTGAMYVLVSAVSSQTSPWVAVFTSPWWNDRYRLITLACVPLCVFAGHGLGQVQHLLTRLLGRLTAPRWPRLVPAAVGATVLAAFAAGTQFFYLPGNISVVAAGYSNSPYRAPEKLTVSKDEVVAMRWLAERVPPGERVMNDRMDGSLWMYAVAGVQPVAGHFDRSLRDPDLTLLTRHFDDYMVSKRVRDAANRMNVHYVMVNSGYVRNSDVREPGLNRLDDRPYLREIYRNPASTIYQVVPVDPELLVDTPKPATPDRTQVSQPGTAAPTG